MPDLDYTAVLIEYQKRLFAGTIAPVVCDKCEGMMLLRFTGGRYHFDCGLCEIKVYPGQLLIAEIAKRLDEGEELQRPGPDGP